MEFTIFHHLNHMKYIIVIITLLLAFMSQSQFFHRRGRIHITKREKIVLRAVKQFEKDKPSKCLKLLEKAESKSRAFCGFTHINTDEVTANLRHSIYLNQGDTLNALKSILNCGALDNTEDVDSLKISYLLKFISKEELKKQIDVQLLEMFNRKAELQINKFSIGFNIFYLNLVFASEELKFSFSEYTLETLERKRLAEVIAGNTTYDEMRFIKDLPFYRMLLP